MTAFALVNGTDQTSLYPFGSFCSIILSTSLFVTVQGVNDSLCIESMPNSAGTSALTTSNSTIMDALAGAVGNESRTVPNHSYTASPNRNLLEDCFNLGRFAHFSENV